MASISFVFVVQPVSRSFVLMIDRRFSIGFRSGEYTDLLNTDSLFFLKNLLPYWTCGREQGPVGKLQNHRGTFFYLPEQNFEKLCSSKLRCMGVIASYPQQGKGDRLRNMRSNPVIYYMFNASKN